MSSHFENIDQILNDCIQETIVIYIIMENINIYQLKASFF